MTEDQYRILKHSLGMRGKAEIPESYLRNRFIGGDSHSDYNTLAELVDNGYMLKSVKMPAFGGDRFYEVTYDGKVAFEDELKRRNANP